MVMDNHYLPAFDLASNLASGDAAAEAASLLATSADRVLDTLRLIADESWVGRDKAHHVFDLLRHPTLDIRVNVARALLNDPELFHRLDCALDGDYSTTLRHLVDRGSVGH